MGGMVREFYRRFEQDKFVIDKNYDMQGMVREFYHRFDQDEFVAPPGEVASVERMGADRVALRTDLIGEEFIELVDATYGVEAGNVLRGALERCAPRTGMRLARWTRLRSRTRWRTSCTWCGASH